MVIKSLFYIILQIIALSNIKADEDYWWKAGDGDFELKVPKTIYHDGGFSITKNKFEIYVECLDRNFAHLNYSTIPSFSKFNDTIDRVDMVQFMFCPLPVDGFKHLFDRLGVKPNSMQFWASDDLSELTNHLNDLKYLEQLSLRKIKIKSFGYMPNLHTLETEVCSMNVSSKLFKNLPNLKSLALMRDNIAEIPDGTFQDIQNLEELSLEWNKLNRLSNSTFATLFKMKELILSFNHLTTIEPNAFKDLVNVWLIDLTHNQLTTIPSNLFEFNSNLQNLILSSNQLVSFEKFSAELPKLRLLDLSYCLLETLDDNLLENMSNLSSISLQGNYITTVSDKFFKAANKLETINLNYNEIRQIGNSFGFLENLKSLGLSMNHIEVLKRGDFVGLRSLEQIDLSRNNISAVSAYTFDFENSLKTIDVSYNKLDTYALEMLTISKNFLTSISFTNNNVSYISTSLLRNFASGRTDEIRINAASNAIETVDLLHLKNIGSTQMFIDLSLNPIMCMCENLDFFQYLKNDSKAHTLHFTGMKNKKCSSLDRTHCPAVIAISDDPPNTEPTYYKNDYASLRKLHLDNNIDLKNTGLEKDPKDFSIRSRFALPKIPAKNENS